jgi:hypothetical protein
MKTLRELKLIECEKIIQKCKEKGISSLDIFVPQEVE